MILFEEHFHVAMTYTSNVMYQKKGYDSDNVENKKHAFKNRYRLMEHVDIAYYTLYNCKHTALGLEVMCSFEYLIVFNYKSSFYI